jgi:hypothetical protein
MTSGIKKLRASDISYAMRARTKDNTRIRNNTSIANNISGMVVGGANRTYVAPWKNQSVTLEGGANLQ